MITESQQINLQREVERLKRLIGVLSLTTSGIAACLDAGEEINATHVDSLFSLLLDEFNDNQQALSQLV